MMKLLAAVASTGVLAAALPAAAATLVYDTATTTAGNQAWGGTLGLDFTANRSVTISALGTFDSGHDGITSDIFVGIFNRTTGVLVVPAINLNGTANPTGAAYVTKAIAPVTLAAGSYQLAAWGYNLGADINFNDGFIDPTGATSPVTFDGLGGALTATATEYSNDNAPGVLATNGDVGATRYAAGTFAAAVPEPAAWTLLIAGFALTGAGLRRRAIATA